MVNIKKTKHDNFINGLIELNYDPYEIINTWLFLCDDDGFTKSKWAHITNDADVPEYSDSCICGHFIKSMLYF